MGETHKAVDLLVDASVGLRTEQRGRREPFLEAIVGTTEEYSESRLLVTYLLKVGVPIFVLSFGGTITNLFDLYFNAFSFFRLFKCLNNKIAQTVSSNLLKLLFERLREMTQTWYAFF